MGHEDSETSLPTSAAEAKSNGQKRYKTGKPCPNGHFSERYASTRGCVACCQANHDKWWRNNRESVYEKNAKWARENKDKAYQSYRKWYLKNKDRVLAKNNKYLKDNPELIKKHQRKWRKKNPHKLREFASKRHAAKLKRIPEWANLEAIAEIYKKAVEISKETGMLHHVDHIYPLQGKRVSGLHVPENLQILTASENCRKNNKMPEDYEKETRG